MISRRAIAVCALGALFGSRLAAQDPARYRTFELRTELASVLRLTGMPSSDVKTIHRRPALLQELEWRPSRWVAGSMEASTDPVEQMIFSFYNDQLYRIVVDYRHDRTEGMTDADMVEAISATYGTTAKRTAGAPRVVSRVEVESGSPVARWGDAEHGMVLYRISSSAGALRLIITDSPLDDLGRKAAIQAEHLDEQEAPRREMARQKKERDDNRAATEKARAANKGVFQP